MLFWSFFVVYCTHFTYQVWLICWKLWISSFSSHTLKHITSNEIEANWANQLNTATRLIKMERVESRAVCELFTSENMWTLSQLKAQFNEKSLQLDSLEKCSHSLLGTTKWNVCRNWRKLIHPHKRQMDCYQNKNELRCYMKLILHWSPPTHRLVRPILVILLSSLYFWIFFLLFYVNFTISMCRPCGDM